MNSLSRSYYSSSIKDFLQQKSSFILGELLKNSQQQSINDKQRNAWKDQIQILKEQLKRLHEDTGKIIFEFTIPRMGKRVDNILLYKNIIFVIEFKCGADKYTLSSKDQVYNYALDLSNFHADSHNRTIVPILICTKAPEKKVNIAIDDQNIVLPILTNGSNLYKIIEKVTKRFPRRSFLDYSTWEEADYLPTPTIIEAAQALYNGHKVEDITRADAEAINLTETTNFINSVIEWSKVNKKKSICFVAGVPGSGKTLVGLNLSIERSNIDKGDGATFLSGNFPLVTVLQNALARDKVKRTKENGFRIKKDEALRETSSFIQEIHKYRDEYINNERIPPEHIVIFDEAQRAWTKDQIHKFMKNKKHIDGFEDSEPEYLISTMDRHKDWAVIVCLIGDGQEINTGEAGLSEWFSSLDRSFPNWNIFTPPIKNNQFISLDQFPEKLKYIENNSLWLSTSMRSFRSSLLSEFVNSLLEVNIKETKELLLKLENYPIFITRSLKQAKRWIKSKCKGSERPGLIASSSGGRLKADGIFVNNKVDVANWFLNDKDDIRSSYYLEDVVTEFDIQGLEIDYSLIAWDADLRFNKKKSSWDYKKLVGAKWQNVNKEERKKYLINAYRVLLTRARQGMIIYIPEGNDEDPTKKKEYYDGTYYYLKEIGIPEIEAENA